MGSVWLLGIAGIMNFAVPMLVGAHDMAFPRMNAFAFWVSVPAAVLLLMSLVLGLNLLADGLREESLKD